MKKHYTTPSSQSFSFYPEHALLLGTSNTEGNGVQLSNKRETPGNGGIWDADPWTEE